jgi:hypothetical protein
VGDWNEDGLHDVAVSTEGGTIGLLLGNGGTGVPAVRYFEAVLESGPVSSVDAGDCSATKSGERSGAPSAFRSRAYSHRN